MTNNSDEINIKLKNVSDSGEKCVTVIDNVKFHKMMFLFNAINDGWTVKKKNNSYIFKKKHENKKEIFEENYLHTFMRTNIDMNTLLARGS
jgi:hypothetical protein